MRVRLWLILVLSTVLISPLTAGPLFNWKKPEKIDPKVRVPELLQALKTDRDENKRSKAAEELRQFDTGQFPEIVPALVAALLTDVRPGVRIDAAQSLARIRPVSQTAGEALEQALEKDPSMRVRLQARSLLLQYHWAGYRSSKKTEVPPLTTISPPPVEKRSGISGLFLPAFRTAPTPTPTVPRPTAPVRPSTSEPPLAGPDTPAPPAAKAPSSPSSAKEDGPILP